MNSKSTFNAKDALSEKNLLKCKTVTEYCERYIAKTGPDYTIDRQGHKEDIFWLYWSIFYEG